MKNCDYIFIAENGMCEKTVKYSEIEFIESNLLIIFKRYRVEEIFIMFLKNFSEFTASVSCYKGAVSEKIQSLSESLPYRTEINRTIINYLSILKMYCDYVTEEVNIPSIKSVFESSEINICTGLRNYVQHAEAFLMSNTTGYQFSSKGSTLTEFEIALHRSNVKFEKVSKKTVEKLNIAFDKTDKIDIIKTIENSVNYIKNAHLTIVNNIISDKKLSETKNAIEGIGQHMNSSKIYYLANDRNKKYNFYVQYDSILTLIDFIQNSCFQENSDA